MRLRRRGFTLIELLVVIAIIGILAAMVFPVFARARESARKVVCLSNVKNIALAIQMYLADNNDTYFPSEHRAEALEYFSTVPGGRPDTSYCAPGSYYAQARAGEANPYLRGPVILNEYVKNRDVWRCPSARFEKGVLWCIPVSDWLGYMQAWQGTWGISGEAQWGYRIAGPCIIAWPSGWGGTVTDNLVQGIQPSGASGAFQQSITTVWQPDMKLVEVQDPVWHIVVAEGGAVAEDTWQLSPGLVAFPDICAAECNGCAGGCDDDCNFTEDEYTDPSLRSSMSRHLGGVNIGFLDGHAAWFHSAKVLNMSPRWSNGVCTVAIGNSDPGCAGRLVEGELTGIIPWGPTSAALGGTPVWETEGCDIAASAGGHGPLY